MVSPTQVWAGLFLIALTVGASCPPNLSPPCQCQEKSKGLDVSCENGHVDQLQTSLATIHSDGQPFLYLKLRNNQLNNFPASLLRGLEVRHFIAINSNISTIDDTAFEGLGERMETLDLAQNSLTRVPSRALEVLVMLVSLNLNYNKIEILHAEAFRGLSSLLRLSLFGNQIKFIDNLAFVGVGGNLTRMNLGGNQLSAVPSRPLKDLQVLQRLQLHENAIAAILAEEFQEMGESLDTLDLSSNLLQELPARAFSNLHLLNSIDLERNKIRFIHIQAFHGIEGSLEWLKIGENELDEIPAAALHGLTRLRQLDLRGNNISRISDEAFVHYGNKLKFVYLQKNRFDVRLFFSKLPRGKLGKTNFRRDNMVLRVINQSVSFFSPIFFIGVPRIQHIDPTSFKTLNSLEWLYLNSNRLRSAPHDTFSPILDTVQVLDLHDNPFECDCGILWLRDWALGSGASRVNMPKEMRCHAPPSLQRLPVPDLSKSQLHCETDSGSPPQHSPPWSLLLVVISWTLLYPL
ncbi:hypothetical protein LAZ67_1004180 [Cordylochernes scorpioides]|uniref:LRRCT domain-containing protein n=1 Tax=Cordylochernes scorpioides TaxID=51811 RepID=A0ABY6JXC9_9ARAC|nr:hypothetical protein LAZ67_1004180 [Cordylochernes scorpioides]